MIAVLYLIGLICMICIMYIAADVEKIRKLVERKWRD